MTNRIKYRVRSLVRSCHEAFYERRIAGFKRSSRDEKRRPYRKGASEPGGTEPKNHCSGIRREHQSIAHRHRFSFFLLYSSLPLSSSPSSSDSSLSNPRRITTSPWFTTLPAQHSSPSAPPTTLGSSRRLTTAGAPQRSTHGGSSCGESWSGWSVRRHRGPSGSSRTPVGSCTVSQFRNPGTEIQRIYHVTLPVVCHGRCL